MLDDDGLRRLRLAVERVLGHKEFTLKSTEAVPCTVLMDDESAPPSAEAIADALAEIEAEEGIAG